MSPFAYKPQSRNPYEPWTQRPLLPQSSSNARPQRQRGKLPDPIQGPPSHFVFPDGRAEESAAGAARPVRPRHRQVCRASTAYGSRPQGTGSRALTPVATRPDSVLYRRHPLSRYRGSAPCGPMRHVQPHCRLEKVAAAACRRRAKPRKGHSGRQPPPSTHTPDAPRREWMVRVS